MSVTPFEHFINLVRFDQKITKTSQAKVAKEKEITQLHEDKSRVHAEIDALKQTVHDAQKAVHEKELDAKKLDTREADIKKKLDDIENAKQYVALKKELESVQTKQRTHEEAVISAWNHLETAERTLQQKKDALLVHIAQIDQSIVQAQQEAQELQHDIDADTAARPQVVSHVNQDWLEKYTNMHGRVTNPVVEVVQGICTGCFYAVPHQDLVRLKNKALLQCNSCYRFLYDPQVLHVPAGQS